MSKSLRSPTTDVGLSAASDPSNAPLVVAANAIAGLTAIEAAKAAARNFPITSFFLITFSFLI